MHNPSCAMTQFHSDLSGVLSYHCQFAEGTLFPDSAVVGLAALANTSTIRNKKNAPNPTPNPSITSRKDHSSFYQPALFFPTIEIMLCRLSLLKERKNTQGKSHPDCESTRPAVGTHGPIQSTPCSKILSPWALGSHLRWAGCSCLQDSRPSHLIILHLLLHLCSVVSVPPAGNHRCRAHSLLLGSKIWARFSMEFLARHCSA